MFIITLLNTETGKEVTVVIVEFGPHSLALQLWRVSRLSGVLLYICSQYSAFERRRAHGIMVGQAVCSNCKQAQCALTTEHSGWESHSEATGTDGTQSRNHRQTFFNCYWQQHTVLAPNPVITRTVPQMAQSLLQKITGKQKNSLIN